MIDQNSAAVLSGVSPQRGFSRAGRRGLILAPTIIPFVILCVLVQRYWVDVPLLDDWEMAPLIVKARQGVLSFGDLFVQHAEARNIVPKLLFILSATGHHWDVRVYMALGIVFCCLTLATLLALLRRSTLSTTVLAVCLFLIALLIFSPAQHELWLLASGFYSFLPVLCIAVGLLVAASRFSVVSTFSICVGLALVSSFTLAHGLLAWALTFPTVFAHRRIARWRLWLGAWMIATFLCALVYFYGYKKPADLPQFAPTASLLDYIHYVVAFLGSAFARSGNAQPLVLATVAGGVLLAGYLYVAIYAIRQWRDAEFRSQVVPWLAIGLYAVGSGSLAALGRIGWGVAQALESRYVAFSIYLAIALIALAPIVLRHRVAGVGRGRGALVWATTCVVAAALLFMHCVCSAASVSWFRKRAAATRLGHGAVLFSQVIDTSKTIAGMTYPRPDFVRVHAEALDELNLLKPKLVRTADVMALRHAVADGKTVAGWLDGVSPAASDQETAWGWSAFTGTARPADCIVLAYSRQADECVAFAVSDSVEERPDVAAMLGGGDQILCGWRATFPRSLVPVGAKISAWAYDVNQRKLFRLNENTPQIKP